MYCNRERTSEEVAIQDNLEIKLWSIGQELRFTRGKMLIHTADLPFPVAQTPDTFTTFRKEVESQLEVRAPLSTPTNINFPFHLEIEENRVPSLCDLGKAPVNIVHEENKNFIGGESYALKQLDYYLFKTNLIATYKQSRNELYGWDFSSKMSPWLALGCISPKLIYSKLKEYEDNVLKNESTYWLFFE